MKRIFQSALMLTISVVMFSACNTTPAEPAALDMTKLKSEIQAMEDAYAAAEKKKDADAVVAYYSDDAISYGRNEEPSSGKAAIKDKMVKRFEKDSTGSTSVYKVVDLFGEGNTLVEIGSWTLMTTDGKEENKGHYMSVFQKRDGKYVCIRDMSASSMPAKPAK